MFGLDTAALLITVKVMCIIFTIIYLLMVFLMFLTHQERTWAWPLGLYEDKFTPGFLKVLIIIAGAMVINMVCGTVYDVALNKIELNHLTEQCTQAGGVVKGRPTECYNEQGYNKSMAILDEAMTTAEKALNEARIKLKESND